LRQEYKKGIPRYLDGELELFEIQPVETVSGFFVDKLKSTGRKIKFERLAIYDRLALEAKSRGIELTMKIRIQPIEIGAHYYVKINNEFHEIANSAIILDNRDNFKKTEISLMKYSQSFEVIEDDI
jgi:hypothetical protein